MLDAIEKIETTTNELAALISPKAPLPLEIQLKVDHMLSNLSVILGKLLADSGLGGSGLYDELLDIRTRLCEDAQPPYERSRYTPEEWEMLKQAWSGIPNVTFRSWFGETDPEPNEAKLTLPCPCCGHEVQSIFQVKNLVSVDGDDDAAFVWEDYCSLAGSLDDDQLKHAAAQLRDPQFEFSSVDCTESWLKADKRMMRAAVLLQLAGGDFSDTPNEADLDRWIDWLESEPKAA